MPTLSRVLLWRYGCAVISVGLAAIVRWALNPVLGDRNPLFLFFVAMVFAAGYGGYGPSLLAMGLSWLTVDYLYLAHRPAGSFFATTGQVAFAFFAVGTAISMFGGFLRRAREHAMAGSAELRTALEALRSHREWLEITFASIADAVITTDPEGLVKFLNPMATRLTGWKPEEALGRKLKEVFRTVQEESQRTKEVPIARIIVEGEIVYSGDEVVLIARDGTARAVEHNAAPIKDARGMIKGAVIVFRDVTARHQAEQALREGEERFRKLADATPVLIWGSDANKSCSYFNKQWLDFTGRTLEQELGKGWTQSVHPDDLQRCVETYESAVDRCTSFSMEYRLQRHDGEYRWVLDNGVPRFAADGTLSGYIGSCIDITDRKRVEEELRESGRRKEEFLAVLSHELRNPLAPIQTALDLIEMRRCGNGEARPGREFAMIKRQVQNLRRLVDDLLDVSRISRGKIELRRCPVEIAALVDKTVEAVRPRFEEHRQELHVSVSSQPIFLDADPTRLEQIMSNLLLNANKYTPQGGKVWLDVQSTQDEVIITVRDTGIGMDGNLLPKVFDLFLQGERRAGLSHEGGGIGLSLARNLVELHGGSITAHSEGPDRGSQFVVRFPLNPTMRIEPKNVQERDDPAASHVLPCRRVLIVDDNVQAADSLGRLLSGVFGQEVRVVYNGSSALKESRIFIPEIVLLDLEMTGMDGYEVAVRLRECPELATAQIVALTGWGHEEDRRRSREMGFDLHLVKPVTAQDLKRLLVELDPARQSQYPPEALADPAPDTESSRLAHRAR